MPTMLFAALKRYADFRGRARRKEYWQFILLYIVVLIVASVLDSVLGIGLPGFGLLYGLASLALLIPSISAYVRRLHDVNKTGWLILLPLAGAVILFAGMGANIAALAGGSPGPGAFAAMGTIGLVGVAVTVIAGLYLFVLCLTPGTPGPNRYGPDPKRLGAERLGEVFS